MKQNTLSEEEEIPVDTPVLNRKFSLDAQKLYTTSPEQNVSLDRMERFKSHDLSPSVSPKASRKVRLASRRGSNFDPNLHVGDVNPPSSPLSRQVSILYDVIFYEIIIFISLQSGSSFNRTTFKRSVCLFVCMSVCLYVCLSIFLSVYLSVCLSIFLSVC